MWANACDASGAPVICAEHLPDPHSVAQLVARRALFQVFMFDCRGESKRQWAYEDFVGDHPEKFERAFEDGEEPAAFVKTLGEDYDLITF
jgi:hypothetical protein